MSEAARAKAERWTAIHRYHLPIEDEVALLLDVYASEQTAALRAERDRQYDENVAKIAEVTALRAEVERLQTAYDQLTGEKFSDRVHVALRQRIDKAEAEVARLRALLRDIQLLGKHESHVCEDIADRALLAAPEVTP